MTGNAGLAMPISGNLNLVISDISPGYEPRVETYCGMAWEEAGFGAPDILKACRRRD
jgi:hypothetical protein